MDKPKIERGPRKTSGAYCGTAENARIGCSFTSPQRQEKERKSHTKVPLTQILEKEFGTGLLSGAIRKRALESSCDVIILDGARWPTDEELIRDLGGIMVYVQADIRTRYERSLESNEKAGESSASFAQFSEEDNAENESYIGEIGARADIKIQNDGSLEELKLEIGNLIEYLEK